MSFDAKQFKSVIIQPTLQKLGMDSYSAINLLAGTCAQESHFGKYIKQINGPALGVYQMEPSTHNDIVNNYIRYKENIKRLLFDQFGYKVLEPEKLIYDLQYATIFSRLHYRRVRESLPVATNLPGLARYWKKYYNTHLGAGTEEEFIRNYNRFL